MTENMFPKLYGYDISEVLYEGTKSLVYRGMRQSDQQPVIIKLLKRSLPSHTELLNFRHQYNILKNIHLEGVVSPLALESWQEKLALVMPDNQSLDLKNYCRGLPLSIVDFLDIAGKIAQILEQLHQQGITHKDIKPGNIVIHPETKQVALIDFSIASQLDIENQSLQNPEALSGTLSYLSPEQTGRMNRCVDYRTDFYSLGITFYELLTGQLPFYSTDAMELVHCHLARKPEAMMHICPDIPPVINDLVQKLMAKNAEDRYQSGTGLLADIQSCQQSLRDSGEITPFTLGQADIARHFKLSEKLYGRFNEINTLNSSFERVCDGQMEAVLISGLSGVGKTALVNEVHNPMTLSRGYFIKGKFEQFKRDTPFSALSQALGGLVEQLLDENEVQKQIWKTLILQALGQQGAVVIELIPELEQLLDKQPAVEDLQGAASRYRFYHLMQQFIQVFTTREHPLILFLDDLQWIDSATLQLLSVILDCQPDPQWDRMHQSLLFIGAWRDNETPPEHPLHHALDKLRQSGLPMHSLALMPLNEDDLNELVVDACHCSKDYAQPLTATVYQKTRGNPFFIHQFLQQAADEELLSYDYSVEHWIYELDSVQQLAASADVVDFMAARLRRLDPDVLNVITLASLFGHQFDLNNLALVAKINTSQCAEYCLKAVQENVLLPLGKAYNLATDLGSYPDSEQAIGALKIQYRFAHDRIQQAAYSLIPDDSKAQKHLNIGCLLKQQDKSDDSVDWLFNVVNQLNAGKHLITASEERLELVELNYQAGQIALRSTAYDAARQYSHNGLHLLETNDSDSWKSHYNLTLKLYEETIEVAFLLADYTEQQRLTDVLLHHSGDILDTIRIHQLHCLSLITQDDPLAAIEYALPILKQLGIEFPEQSGVEDFNTELAKTQALLAERDIATLIDLPLMTDPKILAGMRLLEKLDVALYIAAPALFPLAVFKRIQLAVIYGNAPEIVPFYAAYGFILSGVVNDIDTGYKFSLLAIALLDKLQAQAQKPLTYVNVYGPSFYKKPVRDSIKPLQDASHAGLEVGDLHFSAISLVWANTFSFFSGVDLSELNQDISRDLKLMAGIHQQVSQVYTQMLHQMTLNLSGDSNRPECLQGMSYQLDTSLPLHHKANDRFAVCVAQIYQSILAYLFYDNGKASQAVDMAKSYQDAIIGTLYSPELLFYDSLIQLASCSDKTKSQTKAIFDEVEKNLENLFRLAQHAPMNFQHKWTLVEAERCRISGDILAAQEHYDVAIEGAKENQFMHEEALACELAARFYLQHNKTLIAQAYLTRAYYMWARWGAKAKTEQLETHYPQLLNQLTHGEINPGATIRTSSSDTETSVGMDLDTVMKFAHSLSSELSLSGVLEKLLNTVMENAGAQRTILLLKDSADSSNHLSHWMVSGECRMGTQTQKILHNVPLGEYLELPKTLLQYVIKLKQPVALDDARDSYQAFYNDPYFVQDREQQSVLCQPVLSKGKLLGLLYLENKLTTHVFHQSRQQLMLMMAAQAAISIENAHLYENLEDKVRERTRELKEAQAKLLQHARESGQAEIAIEVMHNIGNALTPLKAKTEQTYSAMHNSDLVKQAPKLMQRLSDALATHVELDSAERDKLTQITKILPEVIADDYQSHADNLEKACDTIRRIEEFIHLQSKYTTVKPMNDYLNVNELLSDALKMLDNMLRSESIKLDLRQGVLPDIYAEEHQLMQVFLSIIKNACEAMALVAIENRHLMINSTVESEPGQVDKIVIMIQDNGAGFNPELNTRIFANDYISVKKQQYSNESFFGRGFKLHACANYLIAHGGHISAQSDGEGKGATFVITLAVN